MTRLSKDYRREDTSSTKLPVSAGVKSLIKTLAATPVGKIPDGCKALSQSAVEKIKLLCDQAYAAGEELLDDAHYDAMIRGMRRHFPTSKALKDVGAAVGRGEDREELPIVIGSLDLCTPATLPDWMRDIERRGGAQKGWLIEPKFDGASLTARYVGGSFQKAWSRGKIVAGKSMGYNITAAARKVQGVVPSIKQSTTYRNTDEFLVRGEVVMHKSIFSAHYRNQESESGKEYKNARNLVSGLMNRSDPEEIATDLKRCTFIALQLFRKVKGKWRRPADAHKEWVLLSLMGFTVATNPARYSKGHWKLKRLVHEGHPLDHTLPVFEPNCGIGELAYWDHIPTEAEVVERMRAIHTAVDIRCDGIVVQPLANGKFQDSGEHLHTHPEFIRAVKLDVQDQESFEGKVGSIEWNISKRGLLKPRLILAQGVEMDGATINHATCNNAGHIVRWGLRTGRRLKLIRSGDVIPRIVAVHHAGHLLASDGEPAKTKVNGWVPLQTKVQKSKRQPDGTREMVECVVDSNGILDEKIESSLPKFCPACKSKLRWTSTVTDLFCPNESCSGRHGQSVVAFFKTLGVDDVAEKTVLDLISHGFDTVAKIMHGATPRRLANLEGYQDRKAQLVSDAVRGAMKGVPLSKVMHASGCFSDEQTSLGSTRLQSIVDALGEGAILRASPNSMRAKLAKIPGVGERTVDMFLEGLLPWRAQFAEISDFYSAPSGPKTLAGTVACWTGFRDPEAEKYLIARGGRVVGSVSKQCTVLFAASLGSSKARRADALQTTVVPQEQMWDWLKERGE